MKTPTKKEQMQMIGGMRMHIGSLERQIRAYEVVVSELIEFLGKTDEFNNYMEKRAEEAQNEVRRNEKSNGQDNSSTDSKNS